MKIRIAIAILLSSMLLVLACQDQSTSDQVISFDNKAIVGKWLLSDAKRNGRPTESLKDAYFNFSSTDKVSTNIFGDESTQRIIWNDSIATVADSSVHYKVQLLQKDTLILNFELQRYIFDITLLKEQQNDSLATFAPSLSSEGL